MSRTLEMVFKNNQNKIVRINIVNAKENLTGAEVKAVMEKIIAEGIFIPGDQQLIEIDGAVVVSVNKEELELA
ncbi:DUF2922 domain-containing protein [Serpentinicella alkaliphila]|uniref:DUF2922 family protein n=1 Tax=Serpentinicella alkaliphila TaxID=1734049 RepID=A0A4V2T3V0_9FIRM|nr:DUF2922 domain-containing protein [Serpentinicella alkaliphila]QUH25015.1 DUF2922 domain-containing protein [Serpentinicella alkaliphila]TCQ02504.1 DUF2922 family protein [Serpentinicella alkaliphila]